MADLSAYEFKADCAAFAKIVDINLRDLMRMLILKVWTGVTLKTPVDTGRARAAWGIVFGEPTIAPIPEGTYGAPAFPAEIQVVDGSQVVYIINALDYIEALEDGHSQQAPAGMVRVTLAEIELEINAIIAEASK